MERRAGFESAARPQKASCGLTGSARRNETRQTPSRPPFRHRPEPDPQGRRGTLRHADGPEFFIRPGPLRRAVHTTCNGLRLSGPQTQRAVFQFHPDPLRFPHRVVDAQTVWRFRDDDSERNNDIPATNTIVIDGALQSHDGETSIVFVSDRRSVPVHSRIATRHRQNGCVRRSAAARRFAGNWRYDDRTLSLRLQR